MAPPAPLTGSACPAGWGNPPRLIGDLSETGASPLGDFSQGLLPATGAPGMVVQMVSPMEARLGICHKDGHATEWQEHVLPAMAAPSMVVLVHAAHLLGLKCQQASITAAWHLCNTVSATRDLMALLAAVAGSSVSCQGRILPPC